MTLDELTSLTEALLEEAGFTLASLRNGGEALSGLSDEQFLLATRFVAGERVEISGPRTTPQAVRRSLGRGVEMTDAQWAAIEHEDELDGAMFAPDVRGVGDVARKVDLGDGVTLGFDS